MWRSALAVLAAPIVWGLVMAPINMLLLGIFPDAVTTPTTNYLLANLLASIGYSFIAGLATAAIAVDRKVRHGLWGGIALLVVGVAVQASAWDLAPVWYHLVFLVLLVPACVGGAVAVDRMRRRDT